MFLSNAIHLIKTDRATDEGQPRVCVTFFCMLKKLAMQISFDCLVLA